MRYRAIRWPCRHPVQVEHGGRLRPATLGNIADAGALIMGLTGARPGEPVRLHLPGGPRPAEVRWAAADRCGVRFSLPLGAAELSVIRGLIGKVQHRLGHVGLREMR